MKKLLSVSLIIGSIITAVLGVFVVLTEIEVLTFLDFAVISFVSFAIGAVLICSPLFAVLLLKQKPAGGICIILSSVASLVFLSYIQSDDITVDPAMTVGAWIIQIAMIVLTITYWLTQRSQE